MILKQLLFYEVRIYLFDRNFSLTNLKWDLKRSYELFHVAFLYSIGSDDYKFIHVEEYGYVTSYAPRVSSGDHQHLLFVRGESEIEVPLPVAPQIQQGTITVDIDLSTQVRQT